ncbi:unnamed protein product, partial [Meganyctiphanes norvegica]
VKGKVCGRTQISGKASTKTLKITYNRKKLKSNQCSTGFICTITVKGGSAIPSVILDRQCDADLAATTLEIGQEMVIFPDIASGPRSSLSCGHTIQSPQGTTIDLVCPLNNIIPGCKKKH